MKAYDTEKLTYEKDHEFYGPQIIHSISSDVIYLKKPKNKMKQWCIFFMTAGKRSTYEISWYFFF